MQRLVHRTCTHDESIRQTEPGSLRLLVANTASKPNGNITFLLLPKSTLVISSIHHKHNHPSYRDGIASVSPRVQTD